jgi:hypothetical protein
LLSSQGRSHPKVKVKSARNQPDIPVLCSASSNDPVEVGKNAARDGWGVRFDSDGARKEGATE